MLFTAREEKARLAARAAVESVRDAENNVIRDVRVAILNLDYAARQKELTADVVASAQQAFQLAQARYDAGSSSIVELSQAQLNLTEAEIAAARARYEYQTRAAVLKFQTGQLR
jgi:outer membrane protein